MPALCGHCRSRGDASRGTGTLGLAQATDGQPQLLFPPGRKPINYLSLLSELARRRRSLMTLATHGVPLPHPHDQRALLSPQGRLAHREAWNEITVLPLSASPPPQAGFGTDGAEAEPQPLPQHRPLLPTTCCGFPAMPEQGIHPCSSPPAPGARGRPGSCGRN